MKKQKTKKSRVGIFKNMSGNISDGNFVGFTGLGGWLGGIFEVNIFRVGVFLIPSKYISFRLTSIHLHINKHVRVNKHVIIDKYFMTT